MSVDGLITIRSNLGPRETMKRFEAEVRAKGMTVFAHIDHAKGASEAGMDLRPTDLLIFGAAKTGTPLMQADQTVGIDLPLKALVWQDQAGATFLSYNDPAYIARRHALGEGFEPDHRWYVESVARQSRTRRQRLRRSDRARANQRLRLFPPDPGRPGLAPIEPTRHVPTAGTDERRLRCTVAVQRRG